MDWSAFIRELRYLQKPRFYILAAIAMVFAVAFLLKQLAASLEVFK